MKEVAQAIEVEYEHQGLVPVSLKIAKRLNLLKNGKLSSWTDIC